jgi:hypothetical protein
MWNFNSRAFILFLALSFPGTALAQSSGTASSKNQPSDSNDEGVNELGYTVHQSVDLGYRYTSRDGSGAMYDTLVNLQSGPRLLDQTLSMQSQNQPGMPFDNLYMNSVGWGGDPNNFLRLRVDKNKWYNFQASFRRDQNFFDYDLLSNPLNPPTSSPNTPVLNSPSEFATTRRMSDVDLTLLPQSKVSFRLGYSHNNMTGPSFTSLHTGTDALLYQPWNTTVNDYRMGVDWKLLPGTVLSYDQTLDYYRGDTTQELAPFEQALLPGGSPVELGLPMDTVNKLPCAIPTGQTSLINSSGVLTNLACNAYLSYSRAQRVRTSTPSERVSLRSNYFDRIEFTASYSYSSADMTAPLNEDFNGLESRLRLRQYTITGPANANQVSDVANVNATIHLTKHVRLIESFNFWAFRIPENSDFSETDWIIPGAGTCAAPTCSLLIPLSGTTQTTTGTLSFMSFNQNWKRNQTEVAWDISKKLGVRIGYRYGDQDFTHFNDFAPGDEDVFLVHEQTALGGIWFRPSHSLRLNLDVEHTNYDNTIVRISPRKESRYRFQGNYTPRPWAVLGGSVNALEDSNNDSLTLYQGHNRNYGFTATLSPRERLSFDLAYNYNDFMQNALICFNDTPPTGVVLPVVINAGSCAANDPNNPLLTNSYYTSHEHYGMAAVQVSPVKRITARLGYSITSVDGTIPQFNILQPYGPLQSTYHQPLADFEVGLGHDLTWVSGWNYYQYSEQSFVGPTAPRYFHANTATVALRYAF